MEIFPQELFDHIIDALQDDDKTLFSCSLVRSSWTHSARRHLFRHFFHSAENSSLDFLDLLSFLRSPRICSYIRTLHLLGGPYIGSAGIDPVISSDLILSMGFLEDLHLEFLTLYPHDATSPRKGTNSCSSRPPHTNRKALQKLHLERICLSGENKLQTLCSFFHSISAVYHLTIEGISSPYDGLFKDGDGLLDQLDLPTGLNVHVLTMRLHQPATRYFTTTFLKSQPSTIRILRLETLSLEWTDLVPHMDIMMLDSVGPGLQDLIIDVGRDGGEFSH